MGRTRKKTCNMRNITLKQLKKKTVLRSDFNIFDFRYEKPKRTDLAVGIVYFNSAKSKRLLMNYLYMVEKLKIADIPVYTLEMFEGEPEINDAFHYKTDFILFQKERLCSLLEKHIPKKFTKLVFMDSDLILDNPNWYNELSDRLNSFNIVQPFSKALWLDITYTKIVKERFSLAFFKKFGKLDLGGGMGGYHPGFAWGFQRAWFNRYGLFEYGILGAGDNINSTTWVNYNFFKYMDFIKPAINAYRASIPKLPSICNLDSSVYHLWHGDKKNRQYGSRMNILKSVNDIRDIVSVGSNGLFVLKDDPVLKRKIRKYFQNRDDDGI